ncbi:MAG: gluconokinase, partial [Spirochaeta sp.]
MIVLIMGVSGSGKSTVAGMVAESLGADYLDADDFHPPANVAKMTRGYPLTDDDRIPWLRAVNARLRQLQQSGSDAVLACSALTQRYRDMLTQGLDTVNTICLHGSPETIAQRIASRKGHFMPPALLQS